MMMTMMVLLMMTTVPLFQIAGQVWHQSFPVLLQILRTNTENNSWSKTTLSNMTIQTS